jgi:hypothetical protein
MKSFLLVADDVIGGFFALDGGGLGGKFGSMFYFAPDSLRWEPMDMGYSQFVYWCFTGDVAGYYADYRWKEWQEDVKNLPGDKAFNFVPFLWAKAEDLESRSRRAVPVAELYGLQMDIAKQLDGQESQ